MSRRGDSGCARHDQPAHRATAGRGGAVNHSPNGADMPSPQHNAACTQPPLSAQLRGPVTREH
jgi:hypothetical protein